MEGISSAQVLGLRFTDVAQRAGLSARNYFGGEKTKRYLLETTGCGAAFFDYDNDGWLDIFLVNGSRLEGFARGQEPTNHLYHNNRDGTFTDVTAQAGLVRTGWGQGVCVGDYDNDGFEDLFVTYWGKNVLYRNKGDSSFTEVTQRAGLGGSRPRWGAGCAFVDYDRDGDLDLFVTNYVAYDWSRVLDPGSTPYCQYKGIAVACGPRGLEGEASDLYHNNGDGTFSDVSEKAGIKNPSGYYGLGVVTADFNNDGWPDIYVANDSTPSILFRNNHDGTFTDVAALAGCAYGENGQTQAGMGVAAGDYNCDGHLDIFKTNFSEEAPNLYHNLGNATFEEATYRAGTAANLRLLGWGCGFFDADNDGWLDIFQVNGHIYPEVDAGDLDVTYKQPKVLYRNLGNGSFEDISRKVGPFLVAPSSSRGCAFGDFDNDGDTDIVINNMNDQPSLLRNDLHSPNNSITIRLLGTRSNRSGIGARLLCVTGTHHQISEVRSGGSYLSQDDLRVQFGLGKAARVDILEIRWPSGQFDTLRDVASNQILYIQEGAGLVRAE